MTAPRPSGDHAGKVADILCIDDDPVVQISLNEVVRNAGARHHEATSAQMAEMMIQDRIFDLILLDRRLPDSDGLLLIQAIRQRLDCPIIVLSQLDAQRDRLLGLGLGATEYMAKPFSPAELSSRIRYVLMEEDKRRRERLSAAIDCGGIHFVPISRQLTVGREMTFLPPAESRLLHLLLQNESVVLNRQRLTREAFGRDWSPGDRTVDVLVARLRKRLANATASIVTVHREGYVLTVD